MPFQPFPGNSCCLTVNFTPIAPSLGNSNITIDTMIIHFLLTGLMLIFPMHSEGDLSYDFKTSGAGRDWRAINDGVMGGLSKGRLSLTDSSMVFSGQLSFANNGGFTSFRAPFGDYDLSKFEKVTIRYRLSGPAFALMLESSDVFWLPHFRHVLSSTEGEWTEIDFPLSGVKQYQLNSPTGKTATKEDLGKLIRIGFISSEKSTEPFSFEIDYLTFN